MKPPFKGVLVSPMRKKGVEIIVEQCRPPLSDR